MRYLEIHQNQIHLQKSRCDQDYMTDVGQGVQTFLALGDTVNGEHSPSSGKFIRQALVEDGPHGKRLVSPVSEKANTVSWFSSFMYKINKMSMINEQPSGKATRIVRYCVFWFVQIVWLSKDVWQNNHDQVPINARGNIPWAIGKVHFHRFIFIGTYISSTRGLCGIMKLKMSVPAQWCHDWPKSKWIGAPCLIQGLSGEDCFDVIVTYQLDCCLDAILNNLSHRCPNGNLENVVSWDRDPYVSHQSIERQAP